MQQILYYFNNIVKQALRQKKYNQIGRFPKFFHLDDKQRINQHRLDAWPGYECQSMLSTQGIFMNIDCCTKFINQTTIYELVNGMFDDGHDDKEIKGMYDSSDTDRSRVTVITEHNSRSYQVDGLDLNLSPLTCNFKMKDGTPVNMKEYFFKQYKIKLHDKQPLLYVNQTRGDKTERIYLPTQLCHEASLPKNFTKDQRKMRDLQQYKINDPNQRKRKILNLVSKFADDATFRSWGIQMEQNLMNINGKKLREPSIVDPASGQPKQFREFVNRGVKHLQPLKVNGDSADFDGQVSKAQWAFVYHEYDEGLTNDIIAAFKKV